MREVRSIGKGAKIAVLDMEEAGFLASFIQVMSIPSLIAAVLGAVVYLEMQSSSWEQQIICLSTTGSAAFAGLLLLSARLKLPAAIELLSLFLALFAACSHIVQGATQTPGSLPPDIGFFQALQAGMLFLGFAAALAACGLRQVMKS